MQLRNARVCLDCEELHEDQQCPVCASESFAFLTRWVPADERRIGSRPQPPPRTPPQPAGRRWVKRGLAGVALIAASRLLWRSAKTDESPESVGDGNAG